MTPALAGVSSYPAPDRPTVTDVPEREPASMSTIDLDTLRARVAADDSIVVDVRPLRFFNGWRAGDDRRGGHIPRAVSYPLEWLHTVDAPELERLLGEKGLTGAGRIIVYGAGADDAERFATFLRTALPSAAVSTFAEGFGTWAADASLAIDKLPRHEQLVHVDWLRQVLAGERTEAAPTGRFLLFHVNFGVPEEYEEDH